MPVPRFHSVRQDMLACGAVPDLATSFGEATSPLRMLEIRTTIEMTRRTTTRIRATMLPGGQTQTMGDMTTAIPRSRVTPTTTTWQRA